MLEEGRAVVKEKSFRSPQDSTTAFGIPVKIEVVDGSDYSTITVRIIDVHHITGTGSWIAGDHCLEQSTYIYTSTLINRHGSEY